MTFARNLACLVEGHTNIGMNSVRYESKKNFQVPDLSRPETRERSYLCDPFPILWTRALAERSAPTASLQ